MDNDVGCAFLNDVAAATHRLVEQKSKFKDELRELALIFVELSENSVEKKELKIREIEKLILTRN